MDSRSLQMGEYRMLFLDYLEKADRLCICKADYLRFKDFAELVRIYGRNINLLSKEEKENLLFPGYRVLKEKYCLTEDLDESIARLETDYQIRTEDEQIAFDRLSAVLIVLFGDKADKIALFPGCEKAVDSLRSLLINKDDSAKRRQFYRQILLNQSVVRTPNEMEDDYIIDGIHRREEVEIVQHLI